MQVACRFTIHFRSKRKTGSTYGVNKKNVASISLAEKCGLKRLPETMVAENVRKIDYVYIVGDIF